MKYLLFLLFGMIVLQASADPLLTLVPAERVIKQNVESQALPKELERYLVKEDLPLSEVSIWVQDIHATNPQVEHNARKVRNPASTMKLFTTWAALTALGPHWQWGTPIYVRGQWPPKVSGQLVGDVVLAGRGDPDLSEQQWMKLLSDIRLKGLQAISGDLVLDQSYYAQVKAQAGDFDQKPTRAYNAIPTPLMVNFQATQLILGLPNVGSIAGVKLHPDLAGWTANNKVTWQEGPCKRSHFRPALSVAGGAVEVKGRYGKQCQPRPVYRLVYPPNDLIFGLFKHHWKQFGGAIKGVWRNGVTQDSDKRIHLHQSSPLGEILARVNKWSNNVMSRQILLTLGAEASGGRGSLAKGQQAVIDAVARLGVNTNHLQIDNGSGLSRVGRASAQQLGELLVRAWHHPLMPEFLNSLPIYGWDGTLAKRDQLMVNGQGRFKTGTINHVSALAGYLITQTGKRLAIVVLINGKGASKGRALQQQVLSWAAKL